MNAAALSAALGTADLVVSDAGFVLSADMPDEPGAAIPWRTLDDLTAGERAAYDAAVIDLRRQGVTIRRGAFALAAAQEGWITEAEALAWAGGQAIPGWVEALIDTAIPAPLRLRMKIEVLTNTEFTRLGALMPLLQAAPQTNGTATDAKVDQIYGIGVGT